MKIINGKKRNLKIYTFFYKQNKTVYEKKTVLRRFVRSKSCDRKINKNIKISNQK